MEFFTKSIDEACGYLVCNYLNEFIYCCRNCASEFKTGIDLENHIRESGHHIKIEKEYLDPLPPLCEAFPLQEIPNDVDTIIEPPKDEDESTYEATDEATDEFLILPDDELKPAVELIREEKLKKVKKTKKEKIYRPEIQEFDKYYCDICPPGRSVYKSKLSIQSHMKYHVQNRLKPFCTICHKRMINYESHMRMNHSPFECQICGKKCTQKQLLEIHLRDHTGERPFLCMYCGKGFKCSNARKVHERSHPNQKLIKCAMCSREFTTLSELKEHFVSIHTSDRPHQCPTCKEFYKTRKYLQRHILTHGEKCHQCRYCDKKFKATESRRWHERHVHDAL